MAPPLAVRVVVLLGAPGSGKSTVGAGLERRGLRWREWEPLILSRWGNRERFVAAKDETLPALHAEIREWVEEAGPIVVIESTGLSDGHLLDSFDDEEISFVVRLDVTEAVALQRVAAREPGRHLTDDTEGNRRIWREFTTLVAPRRRVDLVIDTTEVSSSDAAFSIVSALPDAPP